MASRHVLCGTPPGTLMPSLVGILSRRSRDSGFGLWNPRILALERKSELGLRADTTGRYLWALGPWIVSVGIGSGRGVGATCLRPSKIGEGKYRGGAHLPSWVSAASRKSDSLDSLYLDGGLVPAALHKRRLSFISSRVREAHTPTHDLYDRRYASRTSDIFTYTALDITGTTTATPSPYRHGLLQEPQG